MRVNGVEIALNGTCTLKEFLEQQGYVIERIAVEKNGRIISKTLYETEFLKEDDVLEIVSFVGGG